MLRIFIVSHLLVGMLVLAVFSPAGLPTTVLSQTPSPTYDPMLEPTLPANPTEFELGANLYWHWCSTCHGDRGQGLTDEWRAAWVPDHRNCWARGCHAGHNGDGGFPLPTSIPAIVEGSRLAKFGTLAGLIDFLKRTHPPQSPGVLKDAEYHAIAVYVFSLNDRPPVDPSPALTPDSTPQSVSASMPGASATPGFLAVMLLVLGFAAAIFLKGRGRK